MEHSSAQAPIGIFDSGIGGLTVCKKILEKMPKESIIYFGDTARVPYGSKSRATVIRYAKSCASLLIERGVKLLVIACNTASVFALETLQQSFSVPVIGVVGPGARAACKRSRSGRIGVIGTRGMIGTGCYERKIQQLREDCVVWSKSCPLFVPFVEEGWTEGKIIEEVAQIYLADLMNEEIDTLILGCTHYPLLRKVIGKVMGPSVSLVDSAEETAIEVKEILEGKGWLNHAEQRGEHLFLVSDTPDTFVKTGEQFLGAQLTNVQWVDL